MQRNKGEDEVRRFYIDDAWGETSVRSSDVIGLLDTVTPIAVPLFLYPAGRLHLTTLLSEMHTSDSKIYITMIFLKVFSSNKFLFLKYFFFFQIREIQLSITRLCYI